MLCNSSPQSFWENPAWTHFCCSHRWIFFFLRSRGKTVKCYCKTMTQFNQRVARAFILWKLQTGRLTAGNIDKAAREIASVRAGARLTDTRSATVFHMRIFLLRFRRLKSLPAVKPVLTNIALYHKPAHIVRLPADAVQLGRRHLRTVPKQRSQAGIELGGDSFNYMRKQHREERSARAGRQGHAVASCCINTARDARQVPSSLRNTMIEW